MMMMLPDQVRTHFSLIIF